jgi:hypothetical protein
VTHGAVDERLGLRAEATEPHSQARWMTALRGHMKLDPALGADNLDTVRERDVEHHCRFWREHAVVDQEHTAVVDRPGFGRQVRALVGIRAHHVEDDRVLHSGGPESSARQHR